MSETWIDEKGWEYIKDRLPDSHEWACSYAVREKKKGRAKGGFVIGKKNSWGQKGSTLIKKEEEGLILSEIEIEKEVLVICTVYNGKEWAVSEEKINKLLEEREQAKVIIGGDFNIRTGGLGGIDIIEGGNERRSKDRSISKDGKRLINWIKEKGFYIINGAIDGDWEGEFTYVGTRGSSVIDYILVNEGLYDRVKKLKIDERVESDHMPLNVYIELEEKEEEERSTKEEGKKKDKRNEKEKFTICWDKKSIQKYEEGTEDLKNEEEWRRCSIEEKWKRLKEWISETMIRKKIKRKKKR